MEQITWLILSYQLPTTPSKTRVYVWRKLKDLGAIYFRQGVAMLPKKQRNLNNFGVLVDKIENMNGRASLAELRFLNKQDDQKAVAEFLSQSRKEYKKLISEIAALHASTPVSAEQVVIVETKTRKLEKRLKKIMSRDFFMSHKEPDLIQNFSQLLRDMSEVADNLTLHIARLINDK